MIDLQIARFVAARHSKSRLELLRKAAYLALEHEGYPRDASLSIVLTSQREIQRLNHQYRGLDESTDVLSFPTTSTIGITEQEYLGDVILSYQNACDNINPGDEGRLELSAIEKELTFLTVHGVLHLLGHDHAEEGEKEKMWQVQEEIMQQLFS